MIKGLQTPQFGLLHFDIFGNSCVSVIAQLVEVTDSAVLDGVIEVVSSIPAVGHKIFFSIYIWRDIINQLCR